MIVDRRLLPHLDWWLVAAIVALVSIGLVTIASVNWDPALGQPGPRFWAQLYALGLGLVVMTVALFVDYRVLAQRSVLLYAGLVLALIVVAYLGVVSNGSRRWIRYGGFSLQPSEFGRVVLALVLAMYYGGSRRGARTMSTVVTGGLWLCGLLLLIARQPDLGTAVTLIPVFLGIIYVAGLRMKWLAIAGVVAVLASPLVWTYGLQDYQKRRVQTFLDPSQDPRGDGYQQIQAKITVGSGGLLGKGFGEGTQSTYGFLPVADNDFVFSAFAEEHGFLGVFVTLGLYLFVIVRSLDAARLARDRVGAFLVVGIISGFTFQVVYNITMSAGLAPVKGLTLPLMSYGGSSLLATLAGFGLVLNVRMRRFTN
ncbi:MAG: rod shape-determining protein RodA [Vicinamibacterales bacterium]